MNYIGRKQSLLGFLDATIQERIGGRGGIFFDVFAGTGVVGCHFKQQGFRIVANDVQFYAYCLNRAVVQPNREPRFFRVPQGGSNGRGKGAERVLDYLNDLPGREGFVFRSYCPGGRGRRKYFSSENGRRCDAIRNRIEGWRKKQLLSETEYFYLLGCLIDAMDRVANTASVYGAFLKKLKRSALKPLRLERLPIAPSPFRHRVHNRDGLDLVSRIPCDILYMDPPYNQRQYCTNYHVLETIARNDRPSLRGLTGLRPDDGQRSDFCTRANALPALARMVDKARARYVFLSYNSEGLMPKEEILNVMSRHGKVSLETCDYPRFRADSDGPGRVYKADRVEEYLFCLKKG